MAVVVDPEQGAALAAPLAGDPAVPFGRVCLHPGLECEAGREGTVVDVRHVDIGGRSVEAGCGIRAAGDARNAVRDRSHVGTGEATRLVRCGGALAVAE